MTLPRSIRALCYGLAVVAGMAWFVATFVAVLGLRHYGFMAIWPLHLAAAVLVPGLLWLSEQRGEGSA